MKLVAPVLLLIFVGLACKPPGGQQSRESRNDPPAIAPTIEYTKPRWSNEAGVYLLLSFEVKNTSNRTLEFVKMEASFYDKNDELVRTESPYIAKYTALPAGGRSSAQVQTRYDSRIKSVRIDFSCNGDRSFQKVQIDATEVAKIR